MTLLARLARVLGDAEAPPLGGPVLVVRPERDPCVLAEMQELRGAVNDLNVAMGAGRRGDTPSAPDRHGGGANDLMAAAGSSRHDMSEPVGASARDLDRLVADALALSGHDRAVSRPACKPVPTTWAGC